MVFWPGQKHTNCDIQISIYVDNQNVDRVKKTVVFLEMILHENLNWKSEISHVVNKVSKSMGIKHTSSFYLAKTSLRNIVLFHNLSISLLFIIVEARWPHG